MQLPKKGSSVGTRLRYSRTVSANLTADPKAHVLAAAVQKQHGNIKAKQAAVNDAEDAVIDARAFVNRGTLNICDQVSKLQLDLTVLVGRDYEAPLYRAMLPSGLPELRKLNADDLLKETDRLLAEIAKQAKDSPLQAHGKVLDGLKKSLVPLVATLTKADQALGSARTDRDTAVTEWEQGLDSTYGALKQLFPRKRALVESFFPKPPKKADKPEDAPPPA